jgi:glycosyl transferase family 25
MKISKKTIFSIFIIIIVSIIFFLVRKLFFKTTEYFENFDIKMYVISLKNEDRMNNIKMQENKINSEIEIFDAVKGWELNAEELFKNGIISESYKNPNRYQQGQLGCYMSHLNLLNKIKKENNNGYSIIFEDDFNITEDNFLKEVESILVKINNKNLDFDLIFLGNQDNNKGEIVIDNIHEIDKNVDLYATHAYVVNNKNIDKIIDKIKFINNPIDVNYDYLGKNNILKIYVINPRIVYQQTGKLPSAITGN